MSDLELARQLLKEGKYELLDLLFESVPEVLSQLIRTALIPSKGHRFIVTDFSAIEARIIAWLAGEKWVLDTFKGHGKIYEMTASRMFGVPLERITKGNPEYELRQKGKVAVLACGYQGSTGALIAMGALNMGLTEDELPEIVSSWRKSNPNIVKLWKNIEDAAITAVKERVVVKMQYGLKFIYKSGILFMTLPSGRSLAYVRPRIGIDERFKKEQLSYEGIDAGNQWGRIPTYGGKLTENCIQAIARDCLAVAMLRLDEAGYKIAFHVHDEVILDVPNGFGSLEEVEKIMGQSIPWAPDLPLKAEAFETDYYKKD
jgi:DNA polymerase